MTGEVPAGGGERSLPRGWRRLAVAFRRRGRSPGGERAQAIFRLLYERFREILNLNDSTLELIADVEERLAQRRPFPATAADLRVRQAGMDVFVMVKDLNQIARGRYPGLYDALRRLDREIQGALAPPAPLVGPLVVPMAALRAGDAPLAGTKMANLGEVASLAGLRVPRGFAVTTVAVSRFLAQGDLWARCEGLDETLEREGPAALAAASEQLRADILRAPLPAELEHAIGEGSRAHFGSGAVLAVRSSAVGEDSLSSSHAGLYETVLDVELSALADAYRRVVASAFAPAPVIYRYERGLAPRESLMAVGCIEMVAARCAGILYSRPPEEPDADLVVISATPGVAAAVAAGERSAEVSRVAPGDEARSTARLLASDEVAALIRAARALETHFGGPQDVEWAIDGEGHLVILQARPMVTLAPARGLPGVQPEDLAPLLAGGHRACSGLASGPVVPVRGAEDLADFPEGGVLVARHSSPSFASVMSRCAAIVTDVGSPTGHMASLAREFGVPAIVGLDGAVATLGAGRMVTVDADRCRVLDGAVAAPSRGSRRRVAAGDSPALARLGRIARLVTPLTLTDPASPDFAPESCRSLHDITRFVHEKAYEEMFHYGDVASEDRHHSFRLDARLPIVVRVFDVGGGISADKAPGGRVRPREITCEPMRAFLSGMLEPGIRWDLPRPVSVRGFLSVLGESMAGPPAETLQVGRLSYAIVSDRYLNFSTKAGYHFQTVDAYCGASQNKNYVHFRFHGGAADAERRGRRIRFLSAVLEALDFTVGMRGDLLTARFDKYPAEVVKARLVDLGHLTLCARQLDMLMDSDARPDYFTQAFLASEWEKF